MDLSENQFTARMSYGSRHEEAPWMPRDPQDRSIEAYEHMIGRAMLRQGMDAEEALQKLGNFTVWALVAPSELLGGFYG